MEVIKNRGNYAEDEIHFKGSDTWQTSAQVWTNKVGDCEDHAILLADWLHSNGFEARVVIGQDKKQNISHAFVELNYSSRSLLLEAVDKSNKPDYMRRNRELKERYKAIYAFDRDTLWFGDILQSNRTANGTIKIYKFVKENNLCTSE